MRAPTSPLPQDLRLDEIVSSRRPALAWDNSGGEPPRTYVLQVDTSPSFEITNLVEMSGIPEGVYVTAARVGTPLLDNTRWFWRVKAVDARGAESSWSVECGGVTARFFVNTSMAERLDHMRVPVREVATSGGDGPTHIVDYGGKNDTCWEGAPDRSSHWVWFDLGEPRPISRIFLVSGLAGWKDLAGWRGWVPPSAEWSDRSNLDGRLAAFVWQSSDDGRNWSDLPATERTGSDAFREIFDLGEPPVTARYLRLYVTGWHGRSPRLYDVRIYVRGRPAVPRVPTGNYVLVVNNDLGFVPEPGVVKTDFGKMVRGLGGHVAPPWDLQVLEVPADAFSNDVLSSMIPKPTAIFLTGSPNRFCQLPFFEFNGEFELVKTTDIPTYGACAGAQLMAMAYDRTFARPTGRSYSTKEVGDLVAQDMKTSRN